MKLTDWAERIYAAYPRKVARGAAIKAINAAIKLLARTCSSNGDDVAAWLLVKVEAYAASDEGKGRLRLNGQPDSPMKCIPYPATWFNQERYLDDPKEWSNRWKRKPKPTLAQEEAKLAEKILMEAQVREANANELLHARAAVADMAPEIRAVLKDAVVRGSSMARATWGDVDPLDSPRLCVLMLREAERRQA